MRPCPACTGFIPGHRSTCPHCDRAAAAPATGRWARVGRALIQVLGAGAAMATLAACYGAPAIYDTCQDQDGDGWFPACYDDQGVCDPDDTNCDCNDHDPAINPGAYDPPDGVDRDCDGKDGQRPGGPLPDAWVPVPDAWWQDDAWQEPIDASPPDASVDASAAVDAAP
ncbi:MAG: hypothetical protein H6709_13070 [Kofleriaceae bacterium]|nr:hypothetical protein [Myxococcales bacterium]MCB9561618.1 hypothetical protein [Kofleriaceae bacterium]MCB9573008.1 hypothetical protein [Kofleriaceae bacterium]